LTATPKAQLQLAAGYADLAERHLPDLWYVAHWLADDLSAAEGLVRDTLHAGFRQHGDLRAETETRSWLFKLMYEAYRAGLTEGAARSGGAPATGIASGDGLQRALRSLPVRLRIPILLSDVAGLSYGEIAQALGLPVGAVRARIAEERSQLVLFVESTCPAFRRAHDGSGKRGVGHVGPHVDRARGSG
jgi:RNA polymerase sigma-70 factor (ECF subfamily)